eukprot:CAMPEP_0184675152 /NCGR_PEP_ID=MMETSP0308-20130426/87632_1 /TAXON_ID=38269 /ORGANISM="Gloeochaete witrockiana, Strain SAG 46.84" /LENGTH=105 /DNA_ID=CAMNT_0027122829 /DNA_START=40 /DNA_END=357 /DNA_ORIENTATION=+
MREAVTKAEENRSFLAVAGTLVSGAAAWLGYSAAALHQKSLERKLEKISLQMEGKEVVVKDFVPPVAVVIPSLSVLAFSAFYIFGRNHGYALAAYRASRSVYKRL